MATVKICGLQTVDMVRQTAELPVDHIGFVFARSKRQVTPEQAGELIRKGLHEAAAASRPKAVGVFVNPTLEELEAVMEHAPLDIIQLHGQEGPAAFRSVKERFPETALFKVVSVSGAATGQVNPGAQLEDYRSWIDGVLLDTFDPEYGGGSGKTFAWNAIPPYLSWCREAKLPLLIAGGLRPDNVAELIREYGPDGVDVSSGVETDGVKDLEKIRTFIERVKTIV
ncbi:phosphoribosylanthranilate isomerase [Paenibacillus allorhizosphaerae]|uniref:N-(5'-phosphoribosyl)anthranilate isomerase n=1 Tax=Paenibacillus allorhizosphaerae TaxID=2849866 RepID=A0ABM8VH60_9BACL|nr:phosphoribosylanthranilate isomerase [Paenibacillus allorhizosphaerae]CAG7641082.1 N-(5'-phosphoribosyl)anthranilate isomerase [Paenibacillus allorhizosphaerae]